MFYNRFSNEYNDLYLENINEFQKEMRLISKEDNYYVDNYPTFGFKASESCDFIIYGQAPLGWGTGFSLNQEIDRNKVYSSLIYSNKYPFDSDHTPLDWVNVLWTDRAAESFTANKELKDYYKDHISNRYRAYRSFFWNVCYKLISDYYQFDRSSRNWAKKLLWSNLYKIAPEDANPSEIEKIAQKSIAAKLIQKEIDEINPKFVIVLTNDSWWKPFRNCLNTEPLLIPEYCREIQSCEKYSDSIIIVTKRPRFGNSDEFVRQILRCTNINVTKGKTA